MILTFLKFILSKTTPIKQMSQISVKKNSKLCIKLNLLEIITKGRRKEFEDSAARVENKERVTRLFLMLVSHD